MRPLPLGLRKWCCKPQLKRFMSVQQSLMLMVVLLIMPALCLCVWCHVRYGQRVGCFSLVCDSAAEAGKVESQMKLIARPM